jgi:hypothetical protein
MQANVSQEIDALVRRFVDELSDLVRRQALEAVATVLGAPRAGAGSGAPTSPTQHATSASVPAPGHASRKGEKRSPAELAALERALLKHVRSHPGQGIEMIGKALGRTTSELARPMKKLIAKNQVRTTGTRRATRYFPVEAGGGGSGGSGGEGGGSRGGSGGEAGGGRGGSGGEAGGGRGGSGGEAGGGRGAKRGHGSKTRKG